jgi:hypothetical protein
MEYPPTQKPQTQFSRCVISEKKNDTATKDTLDTWCQLRLGFSDKMIETPDMAKLTFDSEGYPCVRPAPKTINNDFGGS